MPTVHMMKQQDILVKRVKFKNLRPPVIKLIIKRRQSFSYIDLNMAIVAPVSSH
tara:strand:+ start:24 stop:185 length:162 start_codon:yes stop_codon:yes gene_type:complete